MSRTEELNRILRGLQASGEIEAAALISEDGLMIASAMPSHIDELRIAAMSSTLLSLGQRAGLELQRGQLEQVLIRGKDGYAVMVSAASGTMLLVLAQPSAKLGLIFLDMTKAVKDIAKVL